MSRSVAPSEGKTMLTPAEWAQQEARLKRTLAAIHQRLSEIEGLAKWRKDRVSATRRTRWAELPHAGESIGEAIQRVQRQQCRGEFEREYWIYRRLLPILERM